MIRLRTLVPLLVLCAAAGAYAQQDGAGVTPPIIDPPAVPDDVLALGDLATRMTVPVSVAGSKPYPFVIDTGAERSVVSRQLAGRLGLQAGPMVRIRSMTGTSRHGTVVVPSLAVGPIQEDRPFSAPALEASNLGAHGLLGIEQLQAHTVSIDFDRNEMTVRKGRRVNQADAAADEIVVTARSMMGQLIVTNADFDGTRIRVVLDTGAQVSMGNSKLRKRLGRHVPVGQEVTIRSVTGDLLTAPYTVAKQVKMGGVTMVGLPVAFADVEPFEHFGLKDRPALLLGMDALRAFRRVEIDFPNRQVRFLLPKGARLPSSMSPGRSSRLSQE